MSDKFIEFIDEEDGTRTMVCERPDGSRYELRDVKLTGVTEPEPGPGVTVIPLKITPHAGTRRS